ncbi:MAG: lamin tail domain-containing protein [Roseiflexus sp.]|nr:lamin tail domain-containing protein [Roseiflexus sp.]MCS7291135.1 lamin tail domain-containing protein [Roseiflexus sp.]MDW8146243.1 lamin tail domain-containing protein [Roseiflexaceae bacterium]MDW8234479.1 lamin tail domain-containing protein [Roseiflexaceae bacterium]
MAGFFSLTHPAAPLAQFYPNATPSPALYLPLIVVPERPQVTPTAAPTSTPTLPPPSFTSCSVDPGGAINYPVRIVTVLKSANPEVVRLQNVSAFPVNLNGWRMCSIRGSQLHTGIGGVLAPGETRDFPYPGPGFIWNDRESDPGALYDAEGRLISYWPD